MNSRIFILMIFVVCSIVSCKSYRFSNFSKQKFLKGSLREVDDVEPEEQMAIYEEECISIDPLEPAQSVNEEPIVIQFSEEPPQLEKENRYEEAEINETKVFVDDLVVEKDRQMERFESRDDPKGVAAFWIFYAFGIFLIAASILALIVMGILVLANVMPVVWLLIPTIGLGAGLLIVGVLLLIVRIITAN